MNTYLFTTLVSGAMTSGVVILIVGLFVGICGVDAFDYFFTTKNRPKKCTGMFRVLLFNYKCLSQMRVNEPDPWGYDRRRGMDMEDYIGVFTCGIWLTVFPLAVLTGAGFLLRYLTTFESGRMVLLGLSIIAGGLVSGYWLMKGLWSLMGKLGSGIDKVESVVAAVEKTVAGPVEPPTDSGLVEAPISIDAPAL